MSLREWRAEQYDFSGGTLAGVSDLGVGGGGRRRSARHVKASNNATFRPWRAVGVRKGSRDVSNAVLAKQPHSLGKFYNLAGNRLYVACVGGVLYEETASALTAQTTPYTLTDQKIDFEMVNGILVGVQAGGSATPMFYAANNIANTWLSFTLPVPAASLTLTPSTAAGAMTSSVTYWYRYRYRYTNGTSIASTPQSVVMAAGNNTVTVTTIPLDTRTDYLGWTLERTRPGGDATGPFYLVTDGTATSAVDLAADANLLARTNETRHAAAPHLDGLIAQGDRLLGWEGSNLHVSQAVGDAEGTGIFNWQADAIITVAKDDGDSIQCCVHQGDRIVIFKRRSVWALEGFDFASYRLRRITEGTGAAGPRAATASGATVYFDGAEGGLFVLHGDRLQPLAWEEMGSYRDTVDLSLALNAVVTNQLGEYILFWYTKQGDTVPSDGLVLDLRFNVWSHWNGWRMVDALVQKDASDFNAATLLFADPLAVAPQDAGAAALNPSFVTWADARISPQQVYVQKASSAGVPLWTANGVQVGAATAGGAAALASDVFATPDGGCVVVTSELRVTNMAIYAQRFDSAGTKLWNGATGITVCNAAGGDMLNPSICSDGGTGFYVGWEDRRGGTNSRPYVQHLDSSGAALWAANGVAVQTTVVSAHNNTNPRLHPDGVGGVIISYANNTAASGTFTTSHRLQRMTSGFALSWGNAGLTLGTGISNATSPYSTTITPAGDGGCFVAHTDTATSTVVAVRVAAGGTVTWTSANMGSASSSAVQTVADGAGGILAVWLDATGIRMQRVSSTGTLVNSSTGTIAAGTYASLACVSDGAGGIIVTATSGGDVYAAQVNGAGAHVWASSLTTVSAATGTQSLPKLCSDAAGGAILAWQDGRVDIGDIYAQRVNGFGVVQWTANGNAVATPTGQQTIHRIVFTNTPAAEYPVAAARAYHVWTGFAGTVDERRLDGTGGKAILWTIDTPLLDGGTPELWKDLERLTAFIASGQGALSAVLTFEGDAGPVSVNLTTSATGARYDDGASRYDDGVTRYVLDGRREVFAGLPEGTKARRVRITFSGALTADLVLEGWLLAGFLEPEERYS